VLRIFVFLILGIFVFGALFIWWSYGRFGAEIAADINTLRADARKSNTTVTSEMLASLPEPARRYLDYAGIVGTQIPAIVRVTQTGRIRSSADAGWLDLEGEETYSIYPPAFVWRAFLPSRSMPIVIGRDEYLDNKGSILMKMAGIVPIANESGKELAAAGLMRFLNEMMWFPAAFLSNKVTISTDSDNSFGVALADGDLMATATVFVDAEGRFVNFRAQRYNSGTKSMETWETPMTEYGEFSGIKVPIAGSAVWKLADGDFTYIELKVTGVAYDPH